MSCVHEDPVTSEDVTHGHTHSLTRTHTTHAASLNTHCLAPGVTKVIVIYALTSSFMALYVRSNHRAY